MAQESRKATRSTDRVDSLNKAAALSSTYASLLASMQKAAKTFEEIGHSDHAARIQRLHEELAQEAGKQLRSLQYGTGSGGLLWTVVVVLVLLVAVFGGWDVGMAGSSQPLPSREARR